MWWSQHLIYIFFCSFLSFFWFCFATEISTPKDAWRIGVQTILQFQQWAKPISNNLQLVSIGSRFSQRTVWCITNSDWIQNRSWTKCKTMHTVFSNLKFQEQWGLKIFIDKLVPDIKIHNTSTQYSDRALSNLSNKLRNTKNGFRMRKLCVFWCMVPKFQIWPRKHFGMKVDLNKNTKQRGKHKSWLGTNGKN
jgi:hypothetical protein